MAKRGKQKQKQKGKPAAASPADKAGQVAASAVEVPADAEDAPAIDAADADAAAADSQALAEVAEEVVETSGAGTAGEEAAGAEDGASGPMEGMPDLQAESAADEAETVFESEASEADGAAEAAAVAPAPKRPRRVRARDQRSPFLVLADYEQRSLAHVAGLPEQLDAPGLWRGVAYRIGSRRLASGFDEVLEILPMPAVTHIPGSLPWMLGVANIRGTLLPVVDLKQFLEGERTVLQEKQRVLVVHQPGGDVAVTIDELYGQRSFIDAQGVDATAIADGRYAYFVERAYRYGDFDWGVFSLSRLARTPEFRQVAA